MITEDNAIAITALGLLTPWGLGLESFLAGLTSGKELSCPARCPKVDLKEYLPSEKTYLDRCSELALVGASLALRAGGLLDSGNHLQLSLSRRNSGPGGEADTGESLAPLDRLGLGLGTAYGCLDSMYANTQRVQTKGARLASPLLFMHSFINAPASLIAIEWEIRGPGATFTDGGLSAASALYWACDLLRRGTVDVMLVGGVEALSEPLLRAWEADRESQIFRPPLAGGHSVAAGGSPLPSPSRGRTGGQEDEAGPCPIEAACLMLLERAEFARARGAPVLGEITRISPPTALTEEGRRQGEAPYYAFGAQFALRLAAALGELRNQPSGAEVLVEEAEGFRQAGAVLRRA